ncbi:MAG: helix-turn-helix transcriptional regulator [Dehalococcoidia bacterium]
MQATRQQILDFLRQHGEGSVRDLGAHLGLTATGVRQHLAILERESYVVSRELRGHVGRPALTYRLTPTAEALYPKSYGELASALLESARATLREDDYQRLVEGAAETLASPHLPVLVGLSPAERVEAACGVLRSQDVVVTCESDGGGGYVLVERTCPFRDAASRHESVCGMHEALIGRLVGMKATLVSTLAGGADQCVYHLVPANAAAASTAGRSA